MPHPYRVPLEEASDALRAGLDAFSAAAENLTDLELLAPSRAHGWSRLDCLVHVRMGLQELLAGLPAVTEDAPTVDAASYWTAFEAAEDPDPVPGILMTRRTASAYARPRHALEHLVQTADGLRGAVAMMEDTSVRFQGHVLASGDLLATWAVELAVHHHDLALPADAPAPAPAAVRLGRRTSEALVGPDAPPAGDADDLAVMLAGFGRA